VEDQDGKKRIKQKGNLATLQKPHDRHPQQSLCKYGCLQYNNYSTFTIQLPQETFPRHTATQKAFSNGINTVV
jgi:hypothetical protein